MDNDTRPYKSDIRDSDINKLLEKSSNLNYGKYLSKVVLQKLRNFEDDVVSFDFPVTALIGPNGGGKTTVMGAAACAYKDVAPKLYFAKSGIFDGSMQDWSIEYEIIDRDLSRKDVVRRTASFRNYRWRRGAVNRDVKIFGVARTLPAIERSELLRCASSSFTVSSDKISEFPETVQKHVARVLGKDVSGFKSVSVDEKRGEILLSGMSSDGETYSEFHFGAGESSIIRMILEIERGPDQSLILIEEIENGLHPVATIRLVVQR
jgi:predicted ATP-dependent endonuclease of OLD family